MALVTQEYSKLLTSPLSPNRKDTPPPPVLTDKIPTPSVLRKETLSPVLMDNISIPSVLRKEIPPPPLLTGKIHPLSLLPKETPRPHFHAFEPRQSTRQVIASNFRAAPGRSTYSCDDVPTAVSYGMAGPPPRRATFL